MMQANNTQYSICSMWFLDIIYTELEFVAISTSLLSMVSTCYVQSDDAYVKDHATKTQSINISTALKPLFSMGYTNISALKITC